jgi:hypothetical protein
LTSGTYRCAVLAMIRAPQDEVVSALLDGGAGSVSPTSVAGWTAAWIPDLTPIVTLGAQFAVEDEEQGITLHALVDNRPARWSWDFDDASDHLIVLDEAARVLAELLDEADRQSQIRRALGDAQCADELVADLLELHDLAHPWGPVPRNLITLQYGDPATARLAARIAAGEVGTTGLAHLSDGWSVIRAGSGPGAQDTVTMALAAGGPHRRATVLALWRGHGAAAGFELVNRTGVVAAGSWNTGWRDLETDGWESRDAAARALVRDVCGPTVDQTGVRALLRARTSGTDPLAELTALLGVPGAALRVLDGSDGAPELQAMKPAPLWRIVSAAVRDSAPWISRRWLRIAIAGYALVISVVAMGAAAVKYVALATGAFPDGETVATSDWVFAILFTVAVPLNLWCGIQMLRRGTFV